MTTPPPFIVRPARREDVATIVNLIHELAVYEKLADHACATLEALADHLFGPRPFAEALIAEADGGPVGFALFFPTYSTFRGQPSLYLEDLFVRPEFRGRGIGKALLARLARMAVDRGCGRLEWAVLDWNAPSIAFYQSLGARPMSEWTTYRLDESAMRDLAEQSRSAENAGGRVV